ncbi:hypothetical protein ACIBU0_42620 [Streptomyces sp. NPDC049627]|uniref:hypothetical protein n=1 Tax=Streptomyces sp. NPDC049627 TaxID=3365595 RepID=UPI0037A41EFB
MDRSVTPYVTRWTGEGTSAADVTVTASGATYVDPIKDALARDLDGALWTLCQGEASGKPEYAAELHPERQKSTMDGLLCAGCNKPADRNGDGMLWVLPLLDDAEESNWEGIQAAIPPMCAVCADRAPLLCPVLREGHVKLRVREAEPIGVRGTLYPRPGEPGEPQEDVLVLYDSPDLPFVVARQAVRELRRTTVVAFAAALP